MKVLLIEDDEVISQELVKALSRAGWIVDASLDGDEGFEMALLGSYRLILLDVMLPGRDGWQICADLRKAGNATPILMLTAKDEVTDRVKGLDTGADDYLVKPFAFPELEARMRALSRRESAQKSDVLEVGDLSFDTRANRVTRGDTELSLTPREHDLLEALMRNAGRVLSRESIIDRVFNSEDTLPNTVNFHISALRKKIDQPGQEPLIHTVHGLGYKLSQYDS